MKALISCANVMMEQRLIGSDESRHFGRDQLGGLSEGSLNKHTEYIPVVQTRRCWAGNLALDTVCVENRSDIFPFVRCLTHKCLNGDRFKIFGSYGTIIPLEYLITRWFGCCTILPLGVPAWWLLAIVPCMHAT